MLMFRYLNSLMPGRHGQQLNHGRARPAPAPTCSRTEDLPHAALDILGGGLVLREDDVGAEPFLGGPLRLAAGDWDDDDFEVQRGVVQFRIEQQTACLAALIDRLALRVG